MQDAKININKPFSVREKQIRDIFAVCYRFLAQYADGVSDDDWKDIYRYHEGKLDGNDPLAVTMHTACVEELRRQYLAAKAQGDSP